MARALDLIRKQLRKSRERARQLGERADRGLRRATGNRSCIAITGFSGAGKSTLLTSLVTQLLYLQTQQPGSHWPLAKRWLSARLQNHQGGLPDYPLAGQQAALLAGRWPDSTRALSRCLLDIRLTPNHRLQDLSGQGYVNHQLEIWDYPGEWLMDLPLATQDYHRWVLDSFSHFNNEPRNQMAGELYRELLDLDPQAPFDEGRFAALFGRYRDFLRQCKARGLHIVQPGRFVIDGGPPDAEAFLPLLAAGERPPRVPGSWWAEMQNRYDQYVSHWVRPFLTQVFEQVDHQLVLVDLPGALAQGKASLEELRRSLSRVLQLFSYGRNSWLDRLLAPKVEQLTFVSSKLDCVLPDQRRHLSELMRALVAESIQAARFESTRVDHLELAALACTRVSQLGPEPALIVELEQGPARLRHPPIPRGWPTDTDWAALAHWQPPPLSPPKLVEPSQGPWPHINMDLLCQRLLGDE